MADAHPADEPGDGCGVKDVPDHPVCLALVEATFMSASDDTACILTPMLEERQSFTYLTSTVDLRVVEKQA